MFVSLQPNRTQNNMATKNPIRRVRTLYGIVLGVVAACVTLFVLNVFTAAEHEPLPLQASEASRCGVLITDLDAPAAVYREGHAVEGIDSALTATAHVSAFDVSVATDDEAAVSPARAAWCMALQVLAVAISIAIVVLVVWVLVAFYMAAKRGRVFPQKNIAILRWVGGLIIAMSLVLDLSAYIERTVAADLLAGSEWQPQVTATIHVTRIILGLTILFLAEIFSIGRTMQDEQELTI